MKTEAKTDQRNPGRLQRLVRLRDCDDPKFTRRLLKSLRKTLDEETSLGGMANSDIEAAIDHLKRGFINESNQLERYAHKTTALCL